MPPPLLASGIGLLLASGILCSLVGLTVGLPFFIFFKWRGRTERGIKLLVVSWCGFLTLTYPTALWIARSGIRVEMGIDPHKGVEKFQNLNLPAAEISDFNYRFAPMGYNQLADFQMTEEDFLAWMQAQGWQSEKFEADTRYGPWLDPVVHPFDEGEVEDHIVLLGYTCDVEHSSEHIDQIVYDLNTGRVYIQSFFP